MPDADWAARLRQELEHQILPWWQANIFAASDGRVLGGRSHDGRLLELPRSAVLGTRLLWTFASAQLRLGPEPARTDVALAAQRAWDWVRGPLSDAEHGGVFWSVDGAGRPLAEHKQSYAQAFAIYALSACHQWQCTEQRLPPQTMTPALQLFELLEAHAADSMDGGFFEGCTRDWRPLAGAKLSEAEPPAPKSMNTMLHVLEAYTELLRVGAKLPLAARVAARLRELIELFLTRLWLPKQRCFGLFFTRDWQNLTSQVSWGHDIEAAWLLRRACQVLNDAGLLQRVEALAVRVADAVLAQGVAADGRVLGAGLFDGTVTDARSHWWCQAEAMVGFWDAWQIGGDARHADAARRAWAYIDRHHIDRVGGDWFKLLDAQGRPLPEANKAGPWECPYHHVRACLEMLERLT